MKFKFQLRGFQYFNLFTATNISDIHTPDFLTRLVSQNRERYV